MAFAMIPNPNKPGQMKPLVLSPSNMSTFMDCPRKFQGQSMTGEIQWKASTQKSRGSFVHSAIEKALKQGMQAVTNWPDGLDTYYVQQQVQWARDMVAAGGQIHIEHELTIDGRMRPAPEGWWDDNALLRAKADAIVLPSISIPGQIFPAEIIDVKTGKKWDEIDFQLRVEALLVHLIYNKPVVNYAYWYVDIGDTVDGSIDFRNGLDPVKDIIQLIKDMKFAVDNTYFPPKKNKFCKWCGLYQTPACGL